MATEHYLAALDTGPTQCAFTRLLRPHAGSRIKCSPWLDFAADLKYKAMELDELIKKYKESVQVTKPIIHSQLTTQKVASWIFYSNKVEFAGLAEEGDTEALITGQRLPQGTTSEKEVTQTFLLLKKTYTDTPNLGDRMISVSNLEDWHSILFDKILKEPGKLRRSGVQTKDSSDNSTHTYLHHDAVRVNLVNLANVVSKLCKLCTSTLNIFALAAFAQFHFVDIHPFIDGNGRMCRFISKYLLDSVCPLPLPMFRSRVQYLHALESARRGEDSMCPYALLDLLFTEAIAMYKEVLDKYSSWKPRVFACSKQQLETQLSTRDDLTKEELKEVLTKFESLEMGDVIEFSTKNVMFCFELEIDLDSL